ncbi:hypothetical protein ACTQ4E_00145 [Lawsonibacter sp. LCP25S3_G6]|uniref:hypothetical protein n=1 Tax=unclassified Lawsonibacter TaxID=2617946 RepID=UPI003F95A98A
MTQRIIALCRAMGAPEDREELLLLLAQAVEEQLAGRLKAGVTPEDCSAAFPLAAAMLVMDALEECGGSGDVTSFTAGELTIHREPKAGQGRSQQALNLLSPWLGDTGFFFRGVRG